MPALSVGRAWTLALLLPQPSWQAWITQRVLAVCDTQSPETEHKGRAREEAHALAKNIVNKPCHRQHCPGSALPGLLGQTPTVRCSFVCHPGSDSSTRSLHVFTITFLFSLGK